MTDSKPSKDEEIVATVLRALGPWSEKIAIGGGFALLIYRQFVASGLPGKPPAATRDIDSLIQRNVAKVSEQNIHNHLKAAGFDWKPKDRGEPATEAYVKVISEVEVEVEFLTDLSEHGGDGKNVKIAGIVAQPLSYLRLSLENSRLFKTPTGERGFVVDPAAWIFHKGLTFLRRPSSAKKLKDLYGIWYVLTQLEGLSEETVAEFQKLAKQNDKWFETLKSNLTNFKANAVPKDWRLLEQQDPHGQLTEARFKAAIARLGC